MPLELLELLVLVVVFTQVGSKVTLPLDHDEFDEELEVELFGVPQVTLRVVGPEVEEELLWPELDEEVLGPHVTFKL